jgi:anti-sigma B factor antagonist
MAAAPALETCLHQLCADGTTGMVLDLRKLSFMDSTGLRATIVARGLCQEHGCEYRLIQGPPQIRRLFEVSGLLDRLPFAPDEGGVSGGPDSEQTA